MSIEARLQTVEDRLAIYNLLATQPLMADTGERSLVEALYADNVAMERADGALQQQDLAALAELVGREEHRAAIDAGLMHLGNLPLIDLDGDTATAVSYIALLTPEPEGETRYLPNHGDSRGYRVHRVAANEWSLSRTEKGWRVVGRKVVMVGDGAYEMLREAGLRHLRSGSS